MSKINNIEGDFNGSKLTVAIVVARFNGAITSALLDGALDCLLRHSVERANITVVHVPGAFEIPSAARLLTERGGVDAVICLGAVIRGETAHFDYVAGECARGVMQLSLAQHVPIIFGVLTTDTIEQAQQRAGIKGGNNGWSAALSALETATLYKKISS